MDNRPSHPISRQSTSGPVNHPTSSSMKRPHGEPSGPSGESRIEKKKSLTPKSSKEGNGLRVNTNTLQDTISDLQAELEKFRRSCTCVICQELLFEPYFLQCGHVYCYNCIVQWVKQAQSRKTRLCPQCRIPLTIQPAPAYPVRDMIEILVNRAEVQSPTGSGSDLRDQQQEMAELVKSDIQGPGLFKGLFKMHAQGVRDRDDGILRCPECTWEVHHGRCENPACNIRVGSDDFSDMDSEDEELANRYLSGMGGRWIESEFDTELTAEEADDTEEEDEDGWELDHDNSGFSVGLSQDDLTEDDDEPVTNRSRRNGARLDEESEEESDTDTEGSMADFIVHDTPATSRNRVTSRPGRNTAPWVLGSSSPVAEPIQPPRRNARPRVVDDDDDDDPSSMSEASSRPGFRSARRVHVDLSSDYDEDEEESALLRTGYQSLGNQTASENEDDMVFRSRASRRRPFAGVIREEDETESEDPDESEDTDGDVQMQEPVSRAGNSRMNGGRSYGGASLNQPIELDSADESDLPVTRNRRGRRAPARPAAPHNSFYSRASGGNRNRPLSALVDPNIASLFQFHGQRLAEHQLNALGGRRSSVSPARSITPVQHDFTGERRRTGISRDTTPMNDNRTPPPFSPLQQTQTQPQPQSQPPAQSQSQSQPQPQSQSQSQHQPRPSRTASITSEQSSLSALQSPEPQQTRRIHTPINISSDATTPATGQNQFLSSPVSASAPTGSNATLNARIASLSPRLGNRNPFSIEFSSLGQPPVHRVSSPGVRVRSRTSRNQLRNSNSRSGLRGNQAHQSPLLGSGTFSGNSLAAQLGRQTGNASASGVPPGRGRQWTPEDIRRLGMQVRQNPSGQQQQQQQQPQPQLVRASTRSVAGSTRESSVDTTATLTPPPPMRRRVAAQIGQSGEGRNGGGPMLVLGHDS